MRKNPLTMVGRLARTWLLTYQTPAEDARALLPAPFSPVERGGLAFFNVVLCRIESMRPRGVPAALGISYWHVAYRLYARGAGVEGLYFLRSDCDNRLIAAAGARLTDFGFHAARVTVSEEGGRASLEVSSEGGAARVVIDRASPPELPPGSAFGSLDEAAAFLKYKPCGLSLERPGLLNVVRIRRDEAAWRARLVRVLEARLAFFDGKKIAPEICYEVEPIEYRWQRAELLKAGNGE
jgi:hypothetical protein